MRLRKRENSKPARTIDEENEEDVDDPADDSDCDPEWEDPADRQDNSFSNGSGRKRKSFLPLQMEIEQTKVQKLGEPSTSHEVEAKSSPPKDKAADSPAGPTIIPYVPRPRGRPSTFSVSTPLAQTIVKTEHSPGTSQTNTNSGNKPSLSVSTVTTKTMIVTDRKGVPTKCEFKVLKAPKPENSNAQATPSSSKQPTLPPSSFAHGDFLKDITKKGDWIWQVDGMNLLQKFVPTKNPKTGEILYKSSFTYDGLNAMNCPKFQKVSTTIINKVKNEIFVKVHEDLNPLEVKAEPVDPVSENVVSSSEPDVVETKPKSQEPSANKQQPADIRIPLAPAPNQSPAVAMNHNESPGIANYKNTFKDDFTVFLQALISQCLDTNFLRACYNDKDEYFLEKINTIDDVLEAKKFSLMSLPAFPNNERILYAIHMYPIIEEQTLPAIKMENLNCVVCVEQGADQLPACSSLCLKLTGEPYERNTLLNVKLLVDIDDDLKVLRVCSSCSKILKLYSKMCHSKYLIFKQCERAITKTMEKQKEKMEASEVIISLLNNEPWVETKLLQLIKDWLCVDDLKKEA